MNIFHILKNKENNRKSDPIDPKIILKLYEVFKFV